jgi:hypothetical protein
VLTRADIFVLHMIADGSERPVYISTTYGLYGNSLGLGDHLLTQGLARKVVDAAIVPTRDTLMVAGDGWIDTSRSNALWRELQGPATILKHPGWGDPASLNMPEMYVYRGYVLAEALHARHLPGDDDRVAEIIGESNQIADAIGLKR